MTSCIIRENGDLGNNGGEDENERGEEEGEEWFRMIRRTKL